MTCRIAHGDPSGCPASSRDLPGRNGSPVHATGWDLLAGLWMGLTLGAAGNSLPSRAHLPWPNLA